MKFLNDIAGVDIYLLDQLMKGNIKSSHRILDAGCGNGRNLKPFLENEMDIVAIDPKEECIESLRSRYPERSERFIVSSIEEYADSSDFDVVICNAVLHFASNHDHFNAMFSQLGNNLKSDGLLFIRMTSSIGLDFADSGRNGVFQLPDNTMRYLISRSQIDELIKTFEFSLVEPVKTVNVDGLRCMTTLVLRKK